MRRWIPGRLRPPSPAMVVAIAALVAALGGTAVAATATIVNIADPTTPTHKAKVDATGALRTAGTATVSGVVGETAPKAPFWGEVDIGATFPNVLIDANKATVALTRFVVDNYFAQINGAHIHVQLQERSGTASTCDGSTGIRTIGQYDVAAGQSFADAMQSPIVLSPLVAGDVWCLDADADIEGGTSSGYYLPEISFSGYTVSGTLPAGAVASPPAGTSGEPQRAGG